MIRPDHHRDTELCRVGAKHRRTRLLAPCLGALCLFWLAACSPPTGAWYPDTSLRPERPADVAFNDGAGLLGENLLVTLRSDRGEDWIFMVDTGSPVTILDKSLEPELGVRRETKNVAYGWTGQATVGLYDAPKLFLGGTPLRTGPRVWADDLFPFSRRPIQGILGMDCLHYYCLQFDFAARKLRFLDPDGFTPDAADEVFPLSITSICSTTIRADFMGMKNALIGVDTGGYDDGSLGSDLFQRTFREENGGWLGLWTDPAGPHPEAHFAQGVIGSGVYSDLIMMKHPGRQNGLALRFLARHLVTFNFPKRMMCLRPRSAAPRPDPTTTFIETLGDISGVPPDEIGRQMFLYLQQQPGGALTLDGLKFIQNLAGKNQLPGLPEGGGEDPVVVGVNPLDLREADSAAYPARRTLYAQPPESPSRCYYLAVQAAAAAPWKLEKAWRTDASGRVQEEYPLP